MKGYGKVLVVQTAFLGDLILTVPLLRKVKEILPSSEVHALVRKDLLPMLEEMGVADSIIGYDKRGRERGLPALLQKARGIRDGCFDIAISPHTSYRTSLLLYLAGTRERVGFGVASLPFLYTHLVPKADLPFEYMRILSILKHLDGGIDERGYSPYIEERWEWREQGEDLLARYGVKMEGRRPLIGIFPGSVWKTKEWGEERFGLLAGMLRKRGGAVILMGGKGDREKGEHIKSAAGRGIVNICGETSLKDLLHVATCLDLTICNDSAPLHLASILDRPVLAIFGPTIPEFGFGPFSKVHDVAEIDLYCRPCGSHGHRKCPEGHFRCMKDLSPEMIFKKADSLLTRI